VASLADFNDGLYAWVTLELANTTTVWQWNGAVWAQVVDLIALGLPSAANGTLLAIGTTALVGMPEGLQHIFTFAGGVWQHLYTAPNSLTSGAPAGIVGV
jgi:hypothetical protein